MRVLWVTNLFHTPGTPGFRGIFVTQLADSLSPYEDLEIEVEVVAQGRGAPDYLIANRRVRERWETGRFDLVHVHYGMSGLATLLLPRAAPRVATFYGDDINTGWQKAISVATLRRANRRIFVSRRLADQWPSPVNVVLPNGVDFDTCREMPREEACGRLGIDPGVDWILFGGEPANAVKGYDLFSRTVEIVRESIPAARELVLSGAGQTYEHVVWKMNAARCLLFTSRRGKEGSPTVVKEAVAIGLPVVSTDVGDVGEVLDGIAPGGVVGWPEEGGRTGREVLARRLAEGVAEAIRAGTRAPGRSLRSELRQDAIAARLVALYRDVVRESRASSSIVG